MKKNINEYLKNFLSNNDFNLFIEKEYVNYSMFRFRFIGNNLYVQTNEPEISCSLGDFTQVAKFTFKLHYYYDVYRLAEMKSSIKTNILVIQKMYPTDLNKRLLTYLNQDGN